MGKRENKLARRRLVRAYVSSVISISLVLLLIGAASLLAFNARAVSDYFKENVQISVLMKSGVDEDGARGYISGVQALPYVRSTRLVSREEGTAELKQMLGEDFLSVFESSPVPVGVEVTLLPEYVSSDSLAFVIAALSDSPLVDEVGCQQSLVDALNSNLARISMILGVFVLLFLIISFALISNTVRLSVFSQRFTIHTMKLVGATRGFIRRPFLRRSVVQGLVSALIALAYLACGLVLLRRSFASLFEIFKPEALYFTAAVVVVCGVLICLVSTFFIVGRMISMEVDDLY